MKAAMFPKVLNTILLKKNNFHFMNILPTRKEWISEQLLYREVANNTEKYFTKFEVPYVPINGTYFFHINQFDKIPPSRLFEIDFIIGKTNYVKVIDSLENLDTYEKVLDNEYKTTFSYTLGKSNIRVTVYRKINCTGDSEIKAEGIFNRGLKSGNPYTVLPTPEDAILLLICKTLQNITLFFDKALFTKIELISSAPEFSWEKFWNYSREYNIKKFAVYLLLLYKRENKIQLHIPRKDLYSTILSLTLVQKAYNIIPQFMRKLLFKLPFVKNPTKYLLLKLYTKLKEKITYWIKNSYSLIMERIARPAIITAENTAFQSLSLLALDNAKEYTLPTRLNEQFIISTTTGLWVLIDSIIRQITIGSSYGITRIGNRWYASQRTGRYSRIISFCLDLSKSLSVMRDIKIEHTGLSLNIHQIDSYNNNLFIVDTLKNRILYSNNNSKLKRIYPNKLMKNKYPADKNNHFNSVYITNEYLYILAHNSWLNPLKPSQIFVLNRTNFKNYKTIETNAHEAHNIILFNGELIYCDSKGGKLLKGESTLFTDKNHFLRGLAITKNSIVVGGSEIIERSKREFSNSVIWLLDYKGNVKTSINLKKIGQIHEIRGIDLDYGFSASWKNEL